MLLFYYMNYLPNDAENTCYVFVISNYINTVDQAESCSLCKKGGLLFLAFVANNAGILDADELGPPHIQKEEIWQEVKGKTLRRTTSIASLRSTESRVCRSCLHALFTYL